MNRNAVVISLVVLAVVVALALTMGGRVSSDPVAQFDRLAPGMGRDEVATILGQEQIRPDQDRVQITYPSSVSIVVFFADDELERARYMILDDIEREIP